MKIIHTSDWHLGNTVYGCDRTKEQTSMINQMEEILKEETPDALIVSGDIYHTGQPSATVQKFFTESVMRLRAAVPGMVVVIIAGNHDSASKHEISKILWETQGVHVIGLVSKDDPDHLVVDVPGKGLVVAVPYQSDRNIPEGFYQGLLDAAAKRNTAGFPVVMAAHLTVEGCDFTGHEDARGISVGGIDGTPLASLGEGYDYVALGHIHRPQTIQGSGGKVRYSGSPLAVSFDEAYPHSVSVVEISSHGAVPVIREVEIRDIKPLVTLPAKGFGEWEDVKKLLEEFPKDNPAYIRLNVEVGNSLPYGAKEEAKAIVDGTDVTFTYINSKRKAVAAGEAKGITVSQLRTMTPLEVARRYAKDSGMDFTPEMEKNFTEAEKKVKEAELNDD